MNFFRIAFALLVPAVFLAGHAVARDAGRGHAAPTPTARSSPMSIGNRRTATTAYGSGANGSTSPTML
jgi:hypothetical protein